MNKYSEIKEQEILTLYDSGISATKIGKQFGVGTTAITRVLKRFDRKICTNKGSDHPNWKGGRGLKSGYWTVFVEGYHPRKLNIGRVYEHILVAEKKLGRYITKKEPIHHIDFNRQNNKEENLFVCKTTSQHMKIHYSLENIARELFHAGIIEFNGLEYQLKK